MRGLALLFFCLIGFAAVAAEPWQAALAGMPLGTNVAELNRTNCLKLMLPALQSNDVVKALVFMPGATDEFYMFRRAKAVLTNASPTLLDAVSALTNQTRIRATFRPPLLLLHTPEDPLEPVSEIKHPDTTARIRQAKFVPHGVYNDRDWNFMLPILEKAIRVELWPRVHTLESFHFYRHSFAAWNLNGWEALEVVALAGNTRFTVERKRVIFTVDGRFLGSPPMDGWQPR